MSGIPYQKPGVTVSQVTSPVVSPILGEPTSICIIGPANGFQSKTEVVQLTDNVLVQLSYANVDPNSVVVTDYTATSQNGTVYVASTPQQENDYDFDYTNGTIARAMQTKISSGQSLVLVYKNTSGPIYTETLSLTGVAPYTPVNRNTGFVVRSLQAQGIIPSAVSPASVSGQQAVLVNTGTYPTNTMTIALTGGGYIDTGQTVWLDYTDADGNLQPNLPIRLNGTTPVNVATNLGAGSSIIGLANVVVKNAPVTLANTLSAASVYVLGSSESNDYMVLGADTPSPSWTIRRSLGTTTMAPTIDTLSVKVSYTATPAEYWFPTQVFSTADAAAKFGESFDADGNINSPVTYAASLAFSNGATDLMIQALYALTDHTDPTSARSQGADNPTDWASTLTALRDIDGINVLVPVVQATGNTISDGQVLSIFDQVQEHIHFMAQNSQFMVAICGEDSTQTLAGGLLAQASTLQTHAVSLAGGLPAETMVVVSPAAFNVANPVSGQLFNVGGQFIAAVLAGMLAGRPVQQSLTRAQLTGVLGVQDFRSELQKDNDASNGLMVIENRAGVVRCRHAVTVAINDVNTRELNVVRAKQFMTEVCRNTLDQQVIGTIIADTDGRSIFNVQLALVACLETLVSQGVIATYDNIQAQQVASDPTRVQVQFAYVPVYSLNYIDVVFSIDTSSGVVTTGATTQGV